MYQVQKDTIIADVMANAPETMPFFQAIGMHCMGCAMSSGESVEEACAVHGVDSEDFVTKINEYIVSLAEAKA